MREPRKEPSTRDFWFICYAVLTLLSGVSLFGGLLVTSITEEVAYFVFGYPLAAVLLLLAALSSRTWRGSK
jgi:hypothetical protein